MAAIRIDLSKVKRKPAAPATGTHSHPPGHSAGHSHGPGHGHSHSHSHGHAGSHNHAASHAHAHATPAKQRAYALGKKPTYSKVFRWEPSPAHPQKPAAVEIAGSFTNWQRLALEHVGTSDTWQLTMPEIPSNRTHHYMMFVDGKPVSDKNCDGLAIPEGPQEAQFAMNTPRGPRVLMLFAHTK